MTDATQRVAAALRKHFPEELAYSARCSCGKECEYDDDGNWPWADHAAEAAIDAYEAALREQQPTDAEILSSLQPKWPPNV